MVTYIVDTHALVWFIERSSRLGERARQVLLDAAFQLIVPTIVLAEIRFLFAKQRVQIDAAEVLHHITTSANARVYPLDESVIERLPMTLEIHDAIIVSAAMVCRDLLGETAVVVTKDKEIEACGLIETLW